MSKLTHSSSWNIRFNASHSGSYSNALDLNPNILPSDSKVAFYAPLTISPLLLGFERFEENKWTSITLCIEETEG